MCLVYCVFYVYKYQIWTVNEKRLLSCRHLWIRSRCHNFRQLDSLNVFRFRLDCCRIGSYCAIEVNLQSVDVDVDYTKMMIAKNFLDVWQVSWKHWQRDSAKWPIHKLHVRNSFHLHHSASNCHKKHKLYHYVTAICLTLLFLFVCFHFFFFWMLSVAKV